MQTAQRVIAENKFVSSRVKTASGQTLRKSRRKIKLTRKWNFQTRNIACSRSFVSGTSSIYFFPYKHLIDEPWNDVLPRYIPKFEANKDAADYQLTFREMVAEIQDSHGFTRGTLKSAERLGRFTPPVEVKFVENQTVVQYVFDDVKDVKVGDVITAIDGEPIEKFRENYARYIAGFDAAGFDAQHSSRFTARAGKQPQ